MCTGETLHCSNSYSLAEEPAAPEQKAISEGADVTPARALSEEPPEFPLARNKFTALLMQTGNTILFAARSVKKSRSCQLEEITFPAKGFFVNLFTFASPGLTPL